MKFSKARSASSPAAAASRRFRASSPACNPRNSGILGVPMFRPRRRGGSIAPLSRAWPRRSAGATGSGHAQRRPPSATASQPRRAPGHADRRPPAHATSGRWRSRRGTATPPGHTPRASAAACCCGAQRSRQRDPRRRRDRGEESVVRGSAPSADDSECRSTRTAGRMMMVASSLCPPGRSSRGYRTPWGNWMIMPMWLLSMPRLGRRRTPLFRP